MSPAATGRAEPRFRETYDAGRAQIVERRLPGDLETPVSVLLKLGRDAAPQFLLESVEGGNWRGRFSAIGLEPDVIWRVVEGQVEIARRDEPGGLDRFVVAPAPPIEALRAFVSESAFDLPADLPPLAAGVFGYLGYDLARFAERLPEPKVDPIGVPEALLIRPTLVIVFDALSQDMRLVTPVRPAPGLDADAAFEAAEARLVELEARLRAPAPSSATSISTAPRDVAPEPSQPPEAYRQAVRAMQGHIRAGDIFQGVPAQRFSTPFELAPFAFYRALRRLNPSPFLFYFNFGDFAVAGSSPEILVRKRGRAITVRPIAGTRPRGADPTEDAANEAALLADPKERAEHLMLIDLGRNDAGRVAAPGSVRVTQAFAVERYSHVMHIVSNVEADLAEGADAIDALFAGFPAGTVTGAPKVRAMELIHALEPERRGVYAGGVGYISAGGDMDTCIALRTAVIKGGVLHVKAGAGVVFDSDPETERLETEHKAAALFRAAAEAARYV